MIELDSRPARKQDMTWIYALFRRCMKHFIEQTWGWDEVLQAHSFRENLPVPHWTVIEHQSLPIAAYCLTRTPGELYLAMLLVHPDWQLRGVGSQLMTELQQQAQQEGSCLRLDVLRCNPASEFYRRLGFRQVAEDHERFRFLWP